MAANFQSDARRNEYRDDMTGVVVSIRAIVKALRDSGRDAEQKLGITSAQLYVLQELSENPASINELAARTYTHQSSVSMVVARLVEHRLVSRSPARTDARKVLISLTPAGRSVLRKSPDAAQTVLLNALRSLSRTDLKALSSQLRNLVDVMESSSAEPKQSSSRRVSLA